MSNRNVPKCHDCRYYSRNGYCSYWEKQVNCYGSCPEFEED